ncbi:hypothetical protein AB0C96_28225 [Streptomyces sp. NPDC048506]|uniref:hypothetical protein n=1 Tax=Streptomyces sp. NPDC048506 TaxID=3155028 RepID=UPI00342CEE02
MSTDADFADARQIPPIPPRPPRQPAAAAPDEDPRTTALRRRVPAEPSVPPPSAPTVPPLPTAPPGRAAATSAGGTPPPGPVPPAGPSGPAVPPRPTAPPAFPGPATPFGQGRPPSAAAPAPPPPPAGHPGTFRDTAAFHLANSQDAWNATHERAASSAPQPDWTRTPRPPRGVGGLPTAPPRRTTAVRRPGARVIAAAACLVLGIGLIGGAAAGSWLTDDSDDGPPSPEVAFHKGRDAWHNTPVDTLFPRVVEGLGVGPGGADRTWTRIAVAPDGDCAGAYDPELGRVLARAGCVRLLRATYTDATHTSLITVGAQTAKADQSGMLALNTHFSTKSLGDRTDQMPLPYAPKGTPAEGFGRAQRASWTVRVLTDIPVVVYAVSGFADGRTVTEPQPAAAATRAGATTAPAESGLGHDAKDLADRIEADFRSASGVPSQTTESSP